MSTDILPDSMVDESTLRNRQKRRRKKYKNPTRPQNKTAAKKKRKECGQYQNPFLESVPHTEAGLTKGEP